MMIYIKYYVFLSILFVTFACKAQVELEFSKERGFNDNAFDLTIISSEPSTIIRYTLNGDEPSTNNGIIYNGSIPINTTTVLRAIGYIAGQYSPT